MILVCKTMIRIILASILSVALVLGNGSFYFRAPFCHAFSVGDEKKAGEKLLTVIRKDFPLLDEPDISQYINNLGKSVLKAAGPQYFDYKFFVVNNKDFNAFAAPSGLIFFYSGLIEVMEHEGELLSVMAHEIGHVTNRHIAERLAKDKKISIATAALLIAGIAINTEGLSEAMVTGSLAAGAAMSLSYSRENEEEADRVAFDLMQAKSRDPATMVGMLQKMRRVSQYSKGNAPPYLLTHPEPEARLSYVLDLIATRDKKEYTVEDDFAFQRIKNRILVLSKAPETLLPRFLNRVSQVNDDKDKKAIALYGLSQVYLQNAQFDKARETLQQVIDHFPDKPILLTDLAIIYFQEGDFEKSLEILERARKSDQDSSYTAFHLARVLEENGKPQEALKLYNELLSMLPDFSTLYYRIGQIKAAKGETNSAHYHMGIYFWLSGNLKTARYHLKLAKEGLAKDNRTRRLAEEALVKIKRGEGD